MTGFESKRQAAQAKVQEEMQAVFTKRQAERDKLQDEPDMLTIVYQRGFSDGKQAAQRKPLTDEAVGFECRKHFWMHGTRFEDAYKAGFRDSEAAHGIKENT